MPFFFALPRHPFTLLGLLLAAIVSTSCAWAAELTSPLEMVVLGSGGPGATGRAGAGYVLLLDGTPRILVDAGPGTFARLGEARLDVRQLDTVLLTHLHVDHAGELPGIVKARAVSARSDIQFRIFGPDGSTRTADDDGEPAAPFPSTQHFVDLMFGRDSAFPYLKDFAGNLKFNVTNLFGHPSGGAPVPEVILKQGDLVITAIAGHHRDAPAVIYRVDYKGKSITFSGDIDAHGHAALERIAKSTQWLVFNAVVLDPPDSPPILYTLHTAPMDIGKISAAAGVQHLLLSHLPGNIDQVRGQMEIGVRKAYKGPLQFAEDGMHLGL